MIFLNLHTKSQYNSGLQIPCCISFFQTDMIFFDQFTVPTIKFGKCFAEFMIPIALLKRSNREAMNRNWSNERANPALKTKTGNN